MRFKNSLLLCSCIPALPFHSLLSFTENLSTLLQANPFARFGSITTRDPKKYELHMYAENYEVKNIGICVFNSNWISTCFGKAALQALRPRPVICSGSTLGSYTAVRYYVRTMLSSMDTVKCWLKGIESDQGYQVRVADPAATDCSC